MTSTSEQNAGATHHYKTVEFSKNPEQFKIQLRILLLTKLFSINYRHDLLLTAGWLAGGCHNYYQIRADHDKHRHSSIHHPAPCLLSSPPQHHNTTHSQVARHLLLIAAGWHRNTHLISWGLTSSTIYLPLLKSRYICEYNNQRDEKWRLCWVLNNLSYHIPANHPSSSIRMIIQSFRNLSFEIYSELVVRMINIGEQFSKHLLMRVSLRERCQ